MKLKLIFSFLLFIGIALATDETPENKKKTTIPPPTSTSPPTTTTITTTDKPTSSSTSVPTTSTPAPSTTSNPTTAASTTTNPTTAASTTTNPTTAASTTTNPTTVPTTPAPKPEKWEVNDPDHKITCILAMMDIEFDIKGNFTPATIVINPSVAEAEGGTCEGNTQILKVVFNTGNNSTSFMALSFAQNNSEYHVSGLNASIVHNTTKGFIASIFSINNVTLFKTNLNTSYHCSSYEIPSNNNRNETLTVKLSKIYLEAFRKTNTTTFSSSHLCAGDIPDIVPLVVGIALAGLVLVVVIAYLIGRRRSQARGYLSM